MKTFLKIAALVILGIIALKIAFGLALFVLGLIIPVAILALVGLVVWKLIDGKTLWQKLTGSKKQADPYIPAPPAWQADMEDDFNNYQFPNHSLEHKKDSAIKR